ncbi:MAG: hypothetical protein EVA65_12165 [Oceanococcus sp.]|nr:MAG: hypothetical protein EVA65_12165 [Oceanococcus sp.]
MSQSKIAVIHLGLHKTGSTSVQHTVSKYAAYLKDHGWLVPKFSFRGKADANHSVPLYTLFSGQAQRYHILTKRGWPLSEAREAFRFQLSEILSYSGNLLFSGEDLSRLSPPELIELQSTLVNAGFSVRSIVFVRAPLDTCSTTIQQRVKGGKSITQALSEPSFANGRNVRVLNKLQNTLSSLEIYTFDDVCAGGGPPAFLIDLLGIPAPVGFSSQNANTSCSMASIRLMSWINQQLPAIGSIGVNPTRSQGDLQPLLNLSGSKFALLRDEIAPHLGALKEEQAELQTKWGLSFAKQNCDKNDFPSEFQWDDQAVDELIPILPKLTVPIFVRIVDFVYRQYCDQAISEKMYATFCAAAHERARL